MRCNAASVDRSAASARRSARSAHMAHGVCARIAPTDAGAGSGGVRGDVVAVVDVLERGDGGDGGALVIDGDIQY